MTKADLRQIVSDGMNRERSFIAVKIETDGNPAPEIIINPAENVSVKMAYYMSAYTDDLELISAKASGKSVRITDALMTNNLSDINWFIY